MRRAWQHINVPCMHARILSLQGHNQVFHVVLEGQGRAALAGLLEDVEGFCDRQIKRRAGVQLAFRARDLAYPQIQLLP